MDAILSIEPGNKPAGIEKRAAEALFPKLSPPAPPAPKQPSQEPLLDTIRRDRAATASSQAPHIQAVSTSTKPRRVLIEEEEGESDCEAKQPPKPTEPTPKPIETANPPSKVEQTPIPTLPLPASQKAPTTVDTSSAKPSSLSSSPKAEGKASPTAKTPSPRSAVSSHTVPAARPVTVPKTAPKTLYELETAWRTLRREPEKLAQYIRLFKPATYQKVSAGCRGTFPSGVVKRSNEPTVLLSCRLAARVLFQVGAMSSDRTEWLKSCPSLCWSPCRGRCSRARPTRRW